MWRANAGPLMSRVLQANVAALESDPDKWESTLRAMGLDLPGWAGMFKRMQDHPEESPQSCRRDDTCENIPVRLSEFMAVHAILQRSSIEEHMAPDEALLFGGSTLEELGGPAALPHKVRH